MWPSLASGDSPYNAYSTCTSVVKLFLAYAFSHLFYFIVVHLPVIYSYHDKELAKTTHNDPKWPTLINTTTNTHQHKTHNEPKRDTPSREHRVKLISRWSVWSFFQQKRLLKKWIMSEISPGGNLIKIL